MAGPKSSPGRFRVWSMQLNRFTFAHPTLSTSTNTEKPIAK